LLVTTIVTIFALVKD